MDRSTVLWFDLSSREKANRKAANGNEQVYPSQMKPLGYMIHWLKNEFILQKGSSLSWQYNSHLHKSTEDTQNYS